MVRAIQSNNVVAVLPAQLVIQINAKPSPVNRVSFFKFPKEIVTLCSGTNLVQLATVHGRSRDLSFVLTEATRVVRHHQHRPEHSCVSRQVSRKVLH